MNFDLASIGKLPNSLLHEKVYVPVDGNGQFTLIDHEAISYQIAIYADKQWPLERLMPLVLEKYPNDTIYMRQTENERCIKFYLNKDEVDQKEFRLETIYALPNTSIHFGEEHPSTSAIETQDPTVWEDVPESHVVAEQAKILDRYFETRMLFSLDQFLFKAGGPPGSLTMMYHKDTWWVVPEKDLQPLGLSIDLLVYASTTYVEILSIVCDTYPDRIIKFRYANRSRIEHRLDSIRPLVRDYACTQTYIGSELMENVYKRIKGTLAIPVNSYNHLVELDTKDSTFYYSGQLCVTQPATEQAQCIEADFAIIGKDAYKFAYETAKYYQTNTTFRIFQTEDDLHIDVFNKDVMPILPVAYDTVEINFNTVDFWLEERKSGVTMNPSTDFSDPVINMGNEHSLSIPIATSDRSNINTARELAEQCISGTLPIDAPYVFDQVDALVEEYRSTLGSDDLHAPSSKDVISKIRMLVVDYPQQVRDWAELVIAIVIERTPVALLTTADMDPIGNVISSHVSSDPEEDDEPESIIGLYAKMDRSLKEAPEATLHRDVEKVASKLKQTVGRELNHKEALEKLMLTPINHIEVSHELVGTVHCVTTKGKRAVITSREQEIINVNVDINVVGTHAYPATIILETLRKLFPDTFRIRIDKQYAEYEKHPPQVILHVDNRTRQTDDVSMIGLAALGQSCGIDTIQKYLDLRTEIEDVVNSTTE